MARRKHSQMRINAAIPDNGLTYAVQAGQSNTGFPRITDPGRCSVSAKGATTVNKTRRGRG